MLRSIRELDDVPSLTYDLAWNQASLRTSKDLVGFESIATILVIVGIIKTIK